MTFVRVGLIVTGRGEEEFLPEFFRSIVAGCGGHFKVIRRSRQLSPITSEKRLLTLVGRGQQIPSLDETEYGLPARHFLLEHPDSLVLVIDDLEHERLGQVAEVFSRYRSALDTLLTPKGLSGRAAVHFFVNMLEAYYFAHPAAVTNVAPHVHLENHAGDVETIRHPKNVLKQRWPGFNEVEDGKQIVHRLDLHQVLANPDTCCWLRSLFGWCVERLKELGAVHDPSLLTAFQLPNGCRTALTRWQGQPPPSSAANG